MAHTFPRALDQVVERPTLLAVITNVYVDGFNLYYGCLRGTPYTWLDLDALCRRLLPRNTIHRIRYFTCPGDRPPRRSAAAALCSAA